MKKQLISKEFKRMQKLAGLINENEYKEKINETQSFEDFSDVLLNMAIENNIITPEESNDGLVIFVLQGVWDDEFSDYEETGQGISTSDYNRALKIFSNSLKYFRENPID